MLRKINEISVKQLKDITTKQMEDFESEVRVMKNLRPHVHFLCYSQVEKCCYFLWNCRATS